MRIVQVSVGSVRMPPKEGSAPLQVIFNTSKHLAKMGHEVIILDRKYSKNEIDILKKRQYHFNHAFAYKRV